MRQHKYLKRLKQLRDEILYYYGYNSEPDLIHNSISPQDEGLWLIWCALKKDIEKCVMNPDFKIDGIRLYYYNELWKKVNNKDYDLDNINLDQKIKLKKMEDPLDRAEWLAKQPLPAYMSYKK